MNALVMHAESMESIRPLSNFERRAAWAAKYFLYGHHQEFDVDAANESQSEPGAFPAKVSTTVRR